jgi:hypothetical protein
MDTGLLLSLSVVSDAAVNMGVQTNACSSPHFHFIKVYTNPEMNCWKFCLSVFFFLIMEPGFELRAVLLEPHLQSILLWLVGDRGSHELDP